MNPSDIRRKAEERARTLAPYFGWEEKSEQTREITNEILAAQAEVLREVEAEGQTPYEGEDYVRCATLEALAQAHEEARSG